ncbi:unnamed protein product [Ostreobium quekettii]|uniref:Peptidase S1 domain-containing protein n=1 Tax=Ostreobium quekettii TaxID=121088 RepID=A0A8S1JFT9_9CHLO|nr:unnamed protein product [Ostreobium quekettii]|eukprot:evm.model.scf_848.1 EVM.evm.TU.scf_848.1   scf_848:47730-56030(-)
MVAGKALAWVTFALLILAEVGASEKKCYKKEGPEGLTIKFKVTKDDCPTQFLFIVNILDPMVQTHDCTGVLIDPRTVLVPASCVTKTAKVLRDQFPLVRVGSYNLNKPDGLENQETIPVCKKIIHSGFNGNPANGSDIALLELKTPISTQEPIEISATQAADCVGQRLTAVGWFSPRLNGPPSAEVEVLPRLTIVQRNRCRSLLDGLPEGAVCALSDPAANVVWDHGSPLLCDDNVLVGLASYTKNTAGHYPCIYTHVVDYRDWIDSRGEGASRVEYNPQEDCTGRTEL